MKLVSEYVWSKGANGGACVSIPGPGNENSPISREVHTEPHGTSRNLTETSRKPHGTSRNTHETLFAINRKSRIGIGSNLGRFGSAQYTKSISQIEYGMYRSSQSPEQHRAPVHAGAGHALALFCICNGQHWAPSEGLVKT
jgi:hypothetical protein